MGRLGLGVWVSVSFLIFALKVVGNFLAGDQKFPGGECPCGMSYSRLLVVMLLRNNFGQVVHVHVLTACKITRLILLNILLIDRIQPTAIHSHDSSGVHPVYVCIHCAFAAYRNCPNVNT